MSRCVIRKLHLHEASFTHPGASQADKEAKEAIEPPNLGKHKFAPLPLQVLATDDITGSLRQLRTTPVVVKDRFKSLQKRGLIQVCNDLDHIIQEPSTKLRTIEVQEVATSVVLYSALQELYYRGTWLCLL